MFNIHRDHPSMAFREVKAHAIFFLLELEKQGKITREDGYQGILNAIASDVRSKHRKRLDRQHEKEYMKGALKHLSERKKNYEEQINSYNNYVEGAMNTMQRGNQKYVGWFLFVHLFVYVLSQQEAIHSSLHQAIPSFARSAESRKASSVWFLHLQCSSLVRQGNLVVHRPIFPTSIRQDGPRAIFQYCWGLQH
jgi:RasGAP C-terminus